MRSRALLLGLALIFFAGARAAETSDVISVEDFDGPRLARAIFDETNRVRVQLGLKPFGAEPKLDDAADTQARLGSVFRPPSHTNPFPMIATPLDRVKLTGLQPKLVSENIATLSIYDVPPGVGFYRLKGEASLRDSKTGEPLRHHTYESFAAAVVAAWMNSPGHRANIVSQKLRYLGCSVQPAQSRDEVAMIFAVQVFYTPRGRE
ncbi:MAG: hypothetical protein C0518_01115 [Opitutus sp.]|nr:hypothetical protein [Opitutus sp.]